MYIFKKIRKIYMNIKFQKAINQILKYLDFIVFAIITMLYWFM